MRVLMAADGSKQCTAGLVSASHLLKADDLAVDLLCVAPKVDPKKPTLEEKLKRRACRLAERTRLLLADEGVSAKAKVQVGSPARVLMRCAQNYDVVAVAAQSHSDGAVAGLGPVASRVVEHANTTVLLGRGGASESAPRVLVPVDGSEASFHAIEKLGSLVDLAGSEVTLMHVIETPWLRPVDEMEWIAGDEAELDPQAQTDLEREFTQEAETLLEAARDKLPPRSTVDTLVYQGIPSDQILSELNTGDYDLVVLSATGEKDVKHRILGSVSSKVAWNAPCSVLLIHAGDN